ncbi:hypothetical protein BV20DRAFT_1048510 [Pilatotrama ljubarskyi]|nr:hypothetical protein BV20DRAFT_1048510 [Pilatotrama ljubarskyi]
MATYAAQPLEYPEYYAQDRPTEGMDSPLAMDPPFAGPLLASRPPLQVSTVDHTSAYQVAGEYLVRDFFTPSPTSSATSDRTSPSLSFNQETAVPTTPLPSTAPSRREARRRSIASSSADEGLVVRGSIAHPYARLYSKKHGAGKRRKMWNHALEKMLFTPQEISTMGAPHRRTIYTASLEAHVDRLHEQLLSLSLFPVPFDKLEPYRGLNSKTAKSMVSGLHHDASELKLKILELERANRNLEESLNVPSMSYRSCL